MPPTVCSGISSSKRSAACEVGSGVEGAGAVRDRLRRGDGASRRDRDETGEDERDDERAPGPSSAFVGEYDIFRRTRSDGVRGYVRAALGARPYARLNARLNASTDSYPIRGAICETVRFVLDSRLCARCIRQSVR